MEYTSWLTFINVIRLLEVPDIFPRKWLVIIYYFSQKLIAIYFSPPLSLVCHKTSCIWYDRQWILTLTNRMDGLQQQSPMTRLMLGCGPFGIGPHRKNKHFFFSILLTIAVLFIMFCYMYDWHQPLLPVCRENCLSWHRSMVQEGWRPLV